MLVSQFKAPASFLDIAVVAAGLLMSSQAIAGTSVEVSLQTDEAQPRAALVPELQPRRILRIMAPDNSEALGTIIFGEGSETTRSVFIRVPR